MDSRKFIYSSGKMIDVRMSIAGENMRFVRIFDLSPELEDDRLLLVLEDNGKVERVIREKFPVDSGLAHMHTAYAACIWMLKKAFRRQSMSLDKKKEYFMMDSGIRAFCAMERDTSRILVRNAQRGRNTKRNSRKYQWIPRMLM